MFYKGVVMVNVKNIINVEDFQNTEKIITFTPYQEEIAKKFLVETEKKKEHKKIYMVIYHFLKRCFDIIASLCAMIVLLPLFGITCLLIKNDSKGPILFKQMRIGKDGKLFKLYKFRTMVPDADRKLKELLEKDQEARREYKVNKKLKNDPRITKIGKVLRNTSIDELPQLVNVLKGEMSFIGPRPYLPREKEDMVGYYDYIIQTKPGITGLWQVSGRSKTTFDERLKMDFTYNHNISFTQDMDIMFKTLEVLAKKEGAI